MRNPAQGFNSKLSAFKKHQTTPWGRLGYSISIANIERHLRGNSLDFLDVGGGNGLGAIPFATKGHNVTLLDFSSEMLAEARRNAELKGVTDQMTFKQANLAAIPSLFPDPQFDAVLCHNVLSYVDDMGVMLEAVCHALRPNGLLSIMGVNRYSEPYRQALQQVDLSAAYGQLDKETYISAVFEMPVRTYAPEEVLPTLEGLGCRLVGQYGVRCVCDYIFNNELKFDPGFYAQLKRLEYAMSDKYPYYLLARFFQVIARKTDQ
jgi:S-adenosylmethionine-dependent methyltransferase